MEILQERMIPRTVAVGDHPRELAGLEIERRNAAVRRFHDRQARDLRAETRDSAGRRRRRTAAAAGAATTTTTTTTSGVLHRRFSVSARAPDPTNARKRERHGVVHAGVRIERTGVPVARAPCPWDCQHTALRFRDQRRWSVERTEVHRFDRFERLRAELRCEIDQIAFRDTLTIECRWLARNGLRWRRRFSRHVRHWDRPLFDRPHRRTVGPIEDIEIAVL